MSQTDFELERRYFAAEAAFAAARSECSRREAAFFQRRKEYPREHWRHLERELGVTQAEAMADEAGELVWDLATKISRIEARTDPERALKWAAQCHLDGRLNVCRRART